MIKLRLSFGKDENEKSFPVKNGEILRDAVVNALVDVPLGNYVIDEAFVVLVNGKVIECALWPSVQLIDTDEVLLTPKINSGDSGQLFKSALIIVVAIVASVAFAQPELLGPGYAAAFATAGVTIGATLLLNALIPPPIPDLGDIGDLGGGGVSESQMYSISGQSNEVKPYGIVPKIYGSYKFFPPIAAMPYTELVADQETGEMVQWFYAIYDFGLGTPQIGDIKIGDTPFAAGSFGDFEMRFVDPALPDVHQDGYDTGLAKTFALYKGDREVTPLSLSLDDGDESVQNTAPNSPTSGLPQEILLDFQTPRGLYGLNSSGIAVEKTINLDVEWAEIGTENWKQWNDPDHVSSWRSVTGGLGEEIIAPLGMIAPDTSFLSPRNFNTFYIQRTWNGKISNDSEFDVKISIYIKPGTTQLLVPSDPRWRVGAIVYYGDYYIGTIQSSVGVPQNFSLLTMTAPIVSSPKTYGDILVGSWSGKTVQTDDGPVTQWAATPDWSNPFRASTQFSTGVALRGNSLSAYFGTIRFTPKTIGQFKIRVRRISTTGDYTVRYNPATVTEPATPIIEGQDLTWAGITTVLDRQPILTTKRHVFMELKIKATDQLNGNISNLSAVVTQIIPVWNGSAWVRAPSSNPAWIFCDLLTGEVNKRAVTQDRLHMPSIIEWANFCQEIPDPAPPGQTYTKPRFQCDFILDFDTTLQSLLNQIGGSAQASLNIIDGKYGVLIDKLRTTPIQIFTPRNSSGFTSTRNYAVRPDGLRISFIDPNLDWAASEIVVYDNDFDETNADNLDELATFACLNHEQAWRFGRYMIAQNRLRQETITINVDFENLVCTRGDYVQVTQDTMQVGGRPSRVKSINEMTGLVVTDDSFDILPDTPYGYTYRNPTQGIVTSTCVPVSPNSFTLEGGLPAVGDLIVVGEVGNLVIDCVVKAISPNDDLSASITLMERANEIFDYESASSLPDYDPVFSRSSDPNIAPPQSVTQLELTDNVYECAQTKSGYNYFVDFIWGVVPGSIYEHFEVYIDDGRGYRMIQTTTNKLYKFSIDQTRLGIEHGAKVIAVSASGKKLQLAQVPEIRFTPVEKSAPPSDVTTLGMSITDQVLQISWPIIPDCDCAKYEVRFSPDLDAIWESATTLQYVNNSVDYISVQARTGSYFVKAIDYGGRKSLNASEGITTIPNLVGLNFIDSFNDAPTFAGEMQQALKLGDAVVIQENVHGTVATMQYFPDGYYELEEIFDLGEIATCRIQSQIRADGYRFGDLMSDWDHLADVDELNHADSDDWKAILEYRATSEILTMSGWAHLADVDHLLTGGEEGFTGWRPVPTIGDATGRVFQFRVHLQSIALNVTPRLFDASVRIDMTDRDFTVENVMSSASVATTVTYDDPFMGPDDSPNIQISIDGASAGDYWNFDSKTLEGFTIRFYNSSNVQVARQFDVSAKGYGRRHDAVI